MKASEMTGRELDRAVAEKMEWVKRNVSARPNSYLMVWCEEANGQWERRCAVRWWKPTENSSQWWQVVEWMREQKGKSANYPNALTVRSEFYIQLEIQAEWAKLRAEWDGWKGAGNWLLMSCERPGRAICEAFVEAINE